MEQRNKQGQTTSEHQQYINYFEIKCLGRETVETVLSGQKNDIVKYHFFKRKLQQQYLMLLNVIIESF
jgi:hypothetical protein